MNVRTEGSLSNEVLWLEPGHLHFHHGEEVTVKILRGNGMKQGAAQERLELTAFVIDPEGKRRPLQPPVVEGSRGNLSFTVSNEGIYTVIVEAGNGTARVMIPVGHDVSGKGKSLGSGLEILPVYYYQFHHNDTAELQVLRDGAPLTGAVVLGTYHLYEGPLLYPYRLESNERGMFLFTFKEKGHWLFVVEQGGSFSTLVVPGVH